MTKVQLLMEETGCDEGEAELALEMCGYEVEAAVKALPRLLKNIAVLKAKFMHHGAARPDAGGSKTDIGSSQFGLLLVIGNIKTQALLRARAVLSYNPAVYAVSLDKDWFEFERSLYGCRLWDGSLPAESLEIEHSLAQHFRSGLDPKLFGSGACAPSLRAQAPGEGRASAPGDAGVRQASSELGQILSRLLRADSLEVKLKPEVLDLGQFQSLETAPAPRAQTPGYPEAEGSRTAQTLVLKVALEEDPDGTAAADLRPGDLVSASIVDGRDVAQYVARLLGCHPDKGPASIMAPVESAEPAEGGRVARVRFAAGVCGEAVLAGAAKYKVESKDSREALRFQEGVPWWRKLFK
ncbi:MAG: hypothetical protein HY748_07790 [Elusimicrobia bacterium]|nr:hypothetical protein [Elusimicrobiota bacterium]